MRAATMTRAGAVELEDSAETLRDAPAAAAAAVEGRETGAGGDERGERWGRCGRDFELVRKRVRDGGRCARGARAKGRDVPEDDVAVRVGHVGDFVGVQGAVHRVADG